MSRLRVPTKCNGEQPINFFTSMILFAHAQVTCDTWEN